MRENRPSLGNEPSSGEFVRVSGLNVLDASAGAGLLCCVHMSDESAPAPETNSPSTPAASAPRVRRISTPRPKKVAKSVEVAEVAAGKTAPLPVKKSAVEAAVAAPSVSEPAAPVTAPPVADQSLANANAHSDGEWPEPEAASSGGSGSQTDSAKRKRRRRKGKGQSGGAQAGNGGQPPEESHGGAPAEPKSQEFPQESRPRPVQVAQQAQVPQAQPQPPQQHGSHAPRPKVDPELLTKMAWKIYLAEVSEEGVALIGDNDAKDLSRRCFRLAEIFIEEQMRRR